MLIKYSFLICILLLSLTASAQSLITGTVYDTDKNVIPNVKITSLSDKLNFALSDEMGRYSFDPKQKKSIHISFSASGYQSFNLTIAQITESIKLDIILKESNHILDSVIVSATQNSRTINLTLDVFDLKRRSYLLDSSIESLISSFSGVSSTNELSSQYLVRGGNFDENMVYVNGMEIYRPLLIRSGQQEGISFINPNMVKSVGFSTGGYNAEYGDKMSSVLDVNYKNVPKFEGSVGLGLMENSAYIGSSGSKFSQMTSIRYKTTRSLLTTTDTKAEYKPDFIDAQTYVTYKLSKNWDVNFLGNHSYNRYQFTPVTRNTSFGTMDNVRSLTVNFNGWENDKFVTTQASLNIKGRINSKLDLGLSSYIVSSKEQEFYDIGSWYQLASDSENEEEPVIGKHHQHARNQLDVLIFNLKHYANYKLDKHHMKWGISFQRDEINDKIKEWEMRDSAGYTLPNSSEFVSVFSNLKSNNKISSLRFSAFAQDNYKIVNSLGLFNLNFGVRASYWDFNEELLVSPRASLFFIPARNENITIRLAGGMYYQSPFYKEYQQILKKNGNNTVELNRNIKSQRSIHYIVGNDYHFTLNKRPFKLTSEIYYKQLDNIIPYSVNNVKIRYSGQNEGSGYITGLDMRLHGAFVEGTSNWVSLSLMKTQQNINGVKTSLPTDRLYNLAVYLQDYLPGYERLKVNLKGSVTQGLPVNSPYETVSVSKNRMPAYKRLDIGFTWEVFGEKYVVNRNNLVSKSFKNIWLGLDVLNIFDIKNVNTYYWIADASNNQHAVPNYLTGRQINIKLLADF